MNGFEKAIDEYQSNAFKLYETQRAYSLVVGSKPRAPSATGLFPQ